MTTIAFDGKTLAADGGMVVSGMKYKYRGKIRRLKKGGLAGFAGDLDAGQALLKWLNCGNLKREPALPKKPDADVIWIKPDGNIVLLDETLALIDIPEPIMAIGTGAPLAMGALLAGASAREAVEIAISRDPNSGFDVIWLDL